MKTSSARQLALRRPTTFALTIAVGTSLALAVFVLPAWGSLAQHLAGSATLRAAVDDAPTTAVRGAFAAASAPADPRAGREVKSAGTKPKVDAAADSGDKTKKPQVVFKGIVQDTKLQPLAGATVSLVSLNKTDPDEEDTPRSLRGGPGGTVRTMMIERALRSESGRDAPSFFTTKTEPSGAFTIEAEGEGPFNMRVEAPGFAPSVLDKVKPGSAVVVGLKAGHRASGVVADIGTGSPIPDAEVIALPDEDHEFTDPADPKRFAASVRTGRDGSFTLTNLAAGFYNFRVYAPAHALLETDSKAVGDREFRSLSLYLEPGFDVSGRVLGGADKPIEGVTVTALPAQRGAMFFRAVRGSGFARPSGRSDKDGRYTVRGIPGDGKYTFEVRTKDFAPASLAVPASRPGKALTGVDVHLEKGVTLRARFTDAEQKPVSAGVQVEIAYRDPKTRKSGMTVRRTAKELRTGPNGELSIERLPTGNARVRLEIEGFKHIEKQDVAIGRDAKSADLGTIVLDRGKSIAGRVVDDSGKPIPSAKVGASLSGGGRNLRVSSIKTDASGKFTFQGLEEGKWQIEASASGFTSESKDDVDPQGEPIEIALARAGSIKGRVLVGEPAKPVTNFTIESEPKDAGGGGAFRFRMGGGPSKRQTDSRGEFTLGALAPGSYTVTIKADGLQDQVREGVDVRGGEATDMGDITLEAGAILKGRVQSQPGELPVAGAVVRVKKPGLFNFRAMFGSPEGTTLTDLAGRFEIKGLPSGPTSVVVEPENFAKVEAAGVAVTEGETGEELLVTVGKGGRIEGRVIGSDGTPETSATLSASASMVEFSARLTASTDDQGRYAIENVAPGSYRVTKLPMGQGDDDEGAQGGGGQGAKFAIDQISVDVKDGQTAIANFGDKKIKISGAVKRKGDPTKGMQVLFVPSNAAPARMSVQIATVDDTGRYEVSVNEPGEYMIRVGQANNPAGTMMKVTVPDKPEFKYDIVFPEGTLSGRVLDEKSGAPVKGVTVLAVPSANKDDTSRARLRRPGNNSQTGEDGVYHIDGLTAGNWDLTFIQEGYGTELRPAVEVKGTEETSGVDQMMSAGIPFKIRVLNPAGSSLSGALVFVSQGGVPIGGVGGLTREDGTLDTKQLKPGIYTFQALTRELAPGIARDISVGSESDPDSVVINLSNGGGARIVVKDGSKEPISGASVSLEMPTEPDLDTSLQAMAMFGGQSSTGPDGALAIPHLPPGKYEATVTKGDKTVIKPLTVQDGATAELLVTLE